MKYFLITGMDSGYPIEPYIVETEADFPTLPSNDNGDRVRYYEQLTNEDVFELLKIADGIKII